MSRETDLQIARLEAWFARLLVILFTPQENTEERGLLMMEVASALSERSARNELVAKILRKMDQTIQETDAT